MAEKKKEWEDAAPKTAANETQQKTASTPAQNFTAGGNAPVAANPGRLKYESEGTYAQRSQYSQGYQESAGVINARQQLDDALAKLDGYSKFTSQYDDYLTGLYDQIMNRDKFSYDLKSDPFYQQYKDQYQMMGQMAMMDAMGQAAGMTGGYGNSYAAAVGNQAYQSYLQKLNEQIPQFYDRAYQQYQNEGNELYQQYALTRDARQNEYVMWQDEYNRDLDQYSIAANRYSDERNFDYGQYSDNRNYWQNQAQIENNAGWTNAEYQESVRQFNASLAEQQRQHEADMAYKYAALAEDKRQFDETAKQKTEDEPVENLGSWQDLKPSDFGSVQEIGGEPEFNRLDLAMDNADLTDEEAQGDWAATVLNSLQLGYISYEQAEELLYRHGLAER